MSLRAGGPARMRGQWLAVKLLDIRPAIIL
jgi:hypothetical protein